MAKLAKKMWVLITVVPFFLIADQWTKQLILSHFAYGEIYPIVPEFFEITYIRNKGAAFGFLAGAHDQFRIPFFYVVPILVLAVIVWLFVKLPKDHVRMAIALSLVISGALGNLMDRFLHGYVVDFLSFHWKTVYYYPAFNVADSAICVGLGIILLDIFMESRSAARKQES